MVWGEGQGPRNAYAPKAKRVARAGGAWWSSRRHCAGAATSRAQQPPQPELEQERLERIIELFD